VFERHPWEQRAAEAGGRARSGLRSALIQALAARPDLVLVLDVPAPVLRARKPEHDLERIERQRERYRALPSQLPSAVLVDTSGSEEETGRRILAAVWGAWRRRLGGSA
jgi:thymidylate kinase